jgi:hypothetical protein
MSTLSPFPLNVVEIMVRFAYDDYDLDTLQACTLVSKFWREASRRSVYSKVIIRSEARLEEFETLLSTDLTIAPFVYTIVLRLPMDNPNLTNYSLVSKFPRTLPTLLTNLYAIRILGMQNFLKGDGSVNKFVAVLKGFAAFATVGSLSMLGFALDTRLIPILPASLPALQSLSIEHNHITHPSSVELTPESLPPPSEGPSLTTLWLSCGPMFSPAMPAILGWLTSTPSRNTLRSVTLTVRISDAESVGRFLNEVGLSLERLELRFEDYFGLPLETASESLLCAYSRRLPAHTASEQTSRIISLLNIAHPCEN